MEIFKGKQLYIHNIKLTLIDTTVFISIEGLTLKEVN